MSLTVEQCRAARGLLNWSAGDLAAKAGIGIATAKRFESGLSVQASSVDLMRAALERAGVAIIAENEASKRGGAGVRLSPATTAC